MQVIHKNEDKGSSSRRANPVDVVIYTRRIGRYLEGEYIRRIRDREVEYESVGEFLVEIKKEFGGGDEELLKVAELKRIKQGGRTIKEFVQDFKRFLGLVNYYHQFIQGFAFIARSLYDMVVMILSP